MECPDCGFIMTAFDLDCTRCQKYGKPSAKPTPAPNATDNYCSKCGLKNEPTAQNCRQCRTPLFGQAAVAALAAAQPVLAPSDAIDAEDSLHQTEESASRPGAVKFIQATPEQIDAHAQSQVRAEAKQKSGRFDTGPLFFFGWTGLVGAFLVYVGGAALVVGIPLCCCFVWVVYEGFGRPLRGRVGSLDEKKLAGERYIWRNMHTGSCPICNGSIVLIANEDRREVTCAHCRGPLLFDGGYVSPR